MIGSIRVKYTDRPEAEYTTKPRDLIQFERTYQTSLVKAFMDTPHLEHLWFIAYTAAKRVEGVGRLDYPSFDDWVDTLDEVEVLTEDDPAPLDSSPTPGD